MIFFSQFNLFLTHSKEAPSLERNECAFGVMLNNFEVCSEDASRLERLRIDEFFCLKLKFDPSNRMEPVVMCNSVLDIFKSDAKMSLSVSASERNFYFKIHSQNTKKKNILTSQKIISIICEIISYSFIWHLPPTFCFSS